MNEARIARHQLDDATTAFNKAQKKLREHLEKDPETFEHPPLRGYRAYAYILRQIALDAYAAEVVKAQDMLTYYSQGVEA